MTTELVKESSFRKLLRKETNESGLPPLNALYDIIRKEEKKNKIREDKNKQLVQTLELVETAERMYLKQPLIHRMETYMSSNEESSGKEDVIEEEQAANEEVTKIQNETKDEILNLSVDLSTSRDDTDRVKRLLDKWRSEPKLNLKKKKYRKKRNEYDTKTVTTKIYSKSADNTLMRESSDSDEYYHKAKVVQVLGDNSEVRSLIKKDIEYDMVTHSSKISPRIKPKLTSIPLQNKMATLTPLPSNSLYTKSPREQNGTENRKRLVPKKHSHASKHGHSRSQLFSIKSRVIPADSNTNLSHTNEVGERRKTLTNSDVVAQETAVVKSATPETVQNDNQSRTRTAPEPLIGTTHWQSFDGRHQSVRSKSKEEIVAQLQESQKNNEDVVNRLHPKTIPIRGSRALYLSNTIQLHDVWEYWEDYKYKYRPNYRRKVERKYGPMGKTREQAEKLPQITLVPKANGLGFTSVITEGSSSDS